MVKNKIFSLILIVCSLFVFCGCANIEYQRIIDDTGQILDKLIIELDEQEILKKVDNIKLAKLKQDIEDDLEEYVLAINYLKPQLQSKYPDKNFYEGVVARTTPWLIQEGNISRISIEILYKDSTYLQCINGTEDNDSTSTKKENEIVSNLFISKLMMYSDNVFKDMENIAQSYNGVTKTYAIQAGRELRVIVGADQVTDQDAESLSTEIARKIQEEMVYPGQVKITVIRETRSVAFAK